MSKIDDKATVSLFVNGEQAESAMDRLRKKAEDLDKQLQAAMSAGDKKSANKLQRELDKVNKELNRTESAAKGVGIVLDNLSNTSIHGLRNALKYLEKELRMTKPDTEQWRRLADQINLVKGRISELNEKLEGGQSLWGRFKSWAEDTWPAIDLLSRGYDAAVSTLRKYVDAYATMDQEMANVRKFTGMTAEQVTELNEEFKKMDTRTSREDLNKLAQEAGRLGKTSKEDVLGFVRAADKINVALDDLGEGATLTLSKLTGVFGDEAKYGTEKALLKVGSVINELSQNCSASAPYLAQFASRMGGVGSQAKMTIPQIMAFGAVLDANGMAVEASSTALSQVIVRMMQEPAKYAKVAGLDVKKFSDMLKTDVNGALIMFLETLQQAGGMDKLSPMFKDMGENGARAIASLSTLASHLDEVKVQQIEANKAFREGVSIDKEFEVQNTTVQAALDKAKKAATEIRVELGEHLSPLMAHLISSSSAVMRALSVLVRFVFENKSAIVSLAAGIAAYAIAVKAASAAAAAEAAVIKMATATKAAAAVVTQNLKVAYLAMTGQTYAAAKAQLALNAAQRANPLGLLLGLLVTVAGAIMTYKNRVKEAAKAEAEAARQKAEYAASLRQLDSRQEENANNELERVKKLMAAAKDESKSREKRIEAVKKLQNLYPDYFGKLTTEQILVGDTAKAYNSLAASILKAARYRAGADKIIENEGLKADKERELSSKNSVLAALVAEREQLKADLRMEIDRTVESVQYEGDKKRVRAALEAGKAGNAAIQAIRARLQETHAEINSLGDEITALSESVDDIDAVNKEIQTQYGISDEDIAVSLAPGTVPSGPVSPGPRTETDKERRKREAEERRAAAKAKKEFKAAMDSYKAQRMAADLEVLEQYKAGEVDYEILLTRRHENETQYYAQAVALFDTTFADQKDAYLQEDRDYQKLLQERSKADEKYEQTRRALRLETIQREQADAERDAQHMHDVKRDSSLQDEIALQAKLYAIRRQALLEKQALYTEGSKEWADTQFEIEQLEQNRELQEKKLYFSKVAELRKNYEKKSAAERFEMEKAMLDALLEAGYLSAEKYAQYLRALTEKTKQELPGNDHEAWSESDQQNYDTQAGGLRQALESQLLTQAEFNDRMADLDDERRKKMFAGLKQSGGEWNAMLVDVYTSFSHLVDGFDGTLAGTLSNISDCVGAVSSVVGAGLQIATEFAKAESQIQLAAIEKRYDREIELAQGNSYKVARLEKKKEEETARIKNAATKKEYQMKVIQAIAESVQAGLNAYSSTVVIPVVGPALAPAAMAVALAMGATQVALLKKQQQAAEAQGYSQGGFTKPGAVDEPAGIVHAGEWVASQKLLASPVARPMIEALDYAQRTNTIGSLKSEDVSRSIRANDSLARIAEDGGAGALMVAAVAQNSQALGALVDRLKEPFVTVNTVTGDRGIKQAQDDYARLMNNVTPKRNRK